MKRNLQMIAILLVVGLVSGGVLSLVYEATKPKIAEQQLKSLQKAIFIVLPEAGEYEEITKKNITLYKGKGRNGEDAGLAFLAEGNGFQGNIRMIVGTDSALNTIKGIQILESVETPGLGGKITESSFLSQFKDIVCGSAVVCIKNKQPENPNEIQAITGATISSKAVVDIINRKIDRIREAGK